MRKLFLYLKEAISHLQSENQCWTFIVRLSFIPQKKYGGGAGSIVWGLGFWKGKDILGFFKILIWTIVRGELK